MNYKNSLWILAVGFSTSLVVSSCGNGLSAPTTDSDWEQIERLGRPAINEALVLDNDKLNAFNSIPPSADLSDAASPVVAQASSVLGIVTAYDSAGPTATAVAGQFLPDVMRISVNSSDYTSEPNDRDDFAYGSCLNGSGSGPLLCGGRGPKDDVVDFTLNYIVSGSTAIGSGAGSDNVSYTTSGTRTDVSTTFPFLPAPY